MNKDYLCFVCAKPTEKGCSLCTIPFCGVDCQIHHTTICRRIFVDDIARLTLENEEYGPVVIYNDPSGHDQITLMAVKPGKKIPREIHEDLTQFIRIEQGRAKVTTDSDEPVLLTAGSGLVVPAGTYHEVKSLGPQTLKLYSIYSKDKSKKWEH